MAQYTIQPGVPGATLTPSGPASGVPPAATQAASGQYPASVLAAAQQIFASDPSQAAVFQNQYGGDMTAWLNSFTQWWSNFGSTVAGNMAQYAPEANLLSALGYSPGQGGNWQPGPAAVVQPPPLGSNVPGSGPAPAAGTPGSGSTSTPAEEGIYDEVIGGLNNQILNDQNLATDTTNLENQAQTNFGTLGGVLQSAIAPPGGNSAVTTQENAAIDTSTQAQIDTLQTDINNQKTALTQQIATLSGAADVQSQAQLAALKTQLQQLDAAEGSVASARTAAAQGQVTAVNEALASANNTIRGRAALQGFVGGSSMEDNALAQAGIQAGQTAANDVGDASLTNAQEYANIADTGANSQDSIENALAAAQAGITAQGANSLYGLDQTQNTEDFNVNQAGDVAKQGNIQNQYGQSLQAALTNASIPSQEAGSLQSIDNLQNTGLLDAQNALNWWSTTAAAPTPTTTTSTAPTTGNTIASAGSGLLGAATAIGNSQNWWQTPTTTASTTAGTAPFTTPTISAPSTTLIPSN